MTEEIRKPQQPTKTLPTFLYSCEQYKLHRVSPRWRTALNCLVTISGIPVNGGSLLTGGSPAVNEAVKNDALRECFLSTSHAHF
jgi:hypothetical protein